MSFREIFVYPKYPENLERLFKLALNLWSSWNYESTSLFYSIDACLFRKVDRNCLKFLYSLSRERLRALSEDDVFLRDLARVWESFQDYLRHTSNYRTELGDKCGLEQQDVIAYFSMEFGLHECMPLYAGGLGVFSGDFLKSVSDLDLPVVGVGLFYKFGYFTQHIDMNGSQQEKLQQIENHLIPIREVRDSQGNAARVNVEIFDRQAKVKLWQVDIGKSRLILLDTDVEENPPHLRDITNELYVSNREKRLQQELILGIGGTRALNLLGMKVKVYHFNEGHSAFAIIGRLQHLMRERGQSLHEAKAIIRASTVFTTHTPVIAGNEMFRTDLVRKYLEPAIESLGCGFEQIASLGWVDGKSDVFWLPAFAIRFSRYVNGVSSQHAVISRKMWAGLFPNSQPVEIPITSVTDGVHMSCISRPFALMFKRYIRGDYALLGKNEDVWKKVYDIPGEELWENHCKNKRDLVSFLKRRFSQQAAGGPYSRAKIRNVNATFNADALTIVFARRFAAYKRPTLILQDKQRLRKILTDKKKPVQMIFAGKAHPADEQGKRMIREIIDFSRRYDAEDKVIFLENYDLSLAQHFYRGADVWLNNPVDDMEACGTSGMKAAMNGVLHLSTFEGWWRECYDGKNGWAITAGAMYDKLELKNAADANQLYDLIEDEITELYYRRNEVDIPEGWVTMMKNSLYSVCRSFNMNGVLCDYVRNYYIPAIEESTRLSANSYEVLKQAVEQEKAVLRHWDRIKVTSFSTDVEKKDYLVESERVQVKCGVQYEGAPAELFTVELFCVDGKGAYRAVPMEFAEQQDRTTCYSCLLEIEQYGLQRMDARVRPANEIVRDAHPELIKWNE